LERYTGIEEIYLDRGWHKGNKEGRFRLSRGSRRYLSIHWICVR